MELSIDTFNSTPLISHAQLLIVTLIGFYYISENHLKSSHNVNCTEYSIIRNDNNSGTALLFSKDYVFEEVVIDNLQTSCAAAAIIKITDGRQILVVSVYIKCNFKTEQLDHDLQVLDNLQLKSKYIFLGGDFRQTSWGDKGVKINGETLLKWNHDLFPLSNIEMVLSDILTRSSSQSSIDYFLRSDETKQSFQVKSCETSPGMYDHSAVEIQLSSSSELQNSKSDYQVLRSHRLGQIQVRLST